MSRAFTPNSLMSIFDVYRKTSIPVYMEDAWGFTLLKPGSWIAKWLAKRTITTDDGYSC